MDREPVPQTLWDERRELVMAVLALLSIGIGVWSYLTPPRAVTEPVVVLDVLIALTFLADWVYRIARSPRHGRYAAAHAYEIVLFIPYTLIPAVEGGGILRGVRLLRFLRLIRHGRFLRLGLGLYRLPRRVAYLHRVVLRAQIGKIAFSGLALLSLGALGLYAVEVEANPNLVGFAGAWWLALQSFTTVAYAVPNPVTPGGFVLTGVLNVVGLGYFAIFTASLANALLKEPEPDEE